MKLWIRLSGFLPAILLVAMLQPATAQSVSLQAEILGDWTSQKEGMMGIADEMPADMFAYKPTPAQQSYGERVLHVAQANVRFLQGVGGKATAPTIDANATSKAAALQALAASFDYGIALLKEQTDATLVQPAANAPGFLGPSTRARLFTFLMGHTWDIYGQLVVYLRLNGHVPPASQRP